jgi:hypothetical protein
METFPSCLEKEDFSTLAAGRTSADLTDRLSFLKVRLVLYEIVLHQEIALVVVIVTMATRQNKDCRFRLMQTP